MHFDDQKWSRNQGPLLLDSPRGGWRKAAVSSQRVVCLAVPPATGKAALQLPSAPDAATGGSSSPGMETGAGAFPVEVTSSAQGQLGWGIGSRCLRHKDTATASALVLRVLLRSPMGTQQSCMDEAVWIHR